MDGARIDLFRNLQNLNLEERNGREKYSTMSFCNSFEIISIIAVKCFIAREDDWGFPGLAGRNIARSHCILFFVG